jgi:peptidoglycan/LPS O-acetylase OafA/YrhL
MDALALGGLVALLGRSKSKISASPFVVSFAVALGMVILLGSVPSAASSAIGGTIQHSLIDVTFAALLAAIILAPNAKLVTLLRLQPLVYSGRIAYGLYLLHVPAAWIARKLVFRFTSVDVHGLFVDVPITFGAAFIAASLSWHFLELPILALKDRFSSDQSEPVARTA